MMKNMKKTIGRICIAVAAVFILIFSVVQCVQKISDQLESEMLKSLNDVNVQNKKILENEIQYHFNVLMTMGERFVATGKDYHDFFQRNQTDINSYQFKRIGYIEYDGTTHTSDGFTRNLSFRDFFKKSISGEYVISNILEDTIGKKEDINVLSVPLYENGKIIGVFFGTYPTEILQDLLKVEAFDGQGDSCIITLDGNCITKSKGIALDNFFKALETDQYNDQVVQKIKKNMSQEKRGQEEYYFKEKKYVDYMELDIGSCQLEWYVLTIVPSQVLDQRVDAVFRHVIKLMTIVVGVIAVGVIVYLLAYQKSKKELAQVAFQDSLTHGDNFESFKRQMENKEDYKGFLISLDLDDFKMINETYGIGKGNDVICGVWEKIFASLKKNELAARVYSDCFIIYMIGDSKENIEMRLIQLEKSIKELVDVLHVSHIVPKMGVYYLEEKDMDKANGYARLAKQYIKGRRDQSISFYDELVVKRIIQDKQLEDALVTSLTNKDFHIWLQPKFDTQTEKLVGCEALVRWYYQDEVISPALFIPLFEKNGLIADLDEFVFKEICRYLHNWKEANRKVIPVSVNLSRASLYRRDIVAKYLRIIKENDLDIKSVQIEITEDAAADKESLKQIELLKQEGFVILMDDFGSGYSSLQALSLKDFDNIKIDKSLIDGIGNEEGNVRLKHILLMINALGLKITAEGVENKEQLEFLKSTACDEIQGFYFQKPMPRKQFENYLKKEGF